MYGFNSSENNMIFQGEEKYLAVVSEVVFFFFLNPIFWKMNTRADYSAPAIQL